MDADSLQDIVIVIVVLILIYRPFSLPSRDQVARDDPESEGPQDVA